MKTDLLFKIGPVEIYGKKREAHPLAEFIEARDKCKKEITDELIRIFRLDQIVEWLNKKLK